MTAAPPSPLGRRRLPDSVRGILWMVLAMMMFVCNDAIAKHLNQTYPMPQVIWSRFFFHMLPMMMMLGMRSHRIVVTRRLGLQLLRSFLLMCAGGLVIISVHFLQLATVSAMLFLIPIVVTALSAPLLGERVDAGRWLGVLAGLAGAFVIIRPDAEVLRSAAMLPLVAAVCYALFQLATRSLSRTDASLTTLFYSPLAGVAVTTVALPWFWTTPDAGGWSLMVVFGLIACVSNFVLIRALTLAPASTVSPFVYTNILWATAFGYIFFDDVPDAWTLAGAAIIAGSGLYIIRRENAARATP